VNGIHGNGSLALNLVDDDSIQDAASNPLGGPGANNGSFFGPTYLIDQVFPTILSINRAGGAPASTSSSSVDFTATFSKPVTGVGPLNFAIAAGAGVQVTGGISVSTVDGATYTIHVSGISGSGSLGVNLSNPSGIHDTAGNPLASPSGSISFAPRQTFAVGQPQVIEVADLNSDGLSDLIIGNAAGNNLGVMLAHPGGSFGPLATFAAAAPVAMTITDLNGDGFPDVITVGSNHVASFLAGNGDGSFAAPVTIFGGSYVTSVAAADFSGDGRPDLVFGRASVNGQSSVAVVLNTGGGQFSQPQFLPTGNSPFVAVTADVNGDGRPDILTVNTTSSTIGVLTGNGDGSFATSTTFATGSFPKSMDVTDINGDGCLDVVVADFNADQISVLLGNGNGTFQAQRTFLAGSYPSAVRAADLNGDGIPDLICAKYANNSIAVLPGNGDGTFAPAQTFATGSLPKWVSVGDLSGDGRCDVISADSASSTLSIFLTPSPGVFVGQTYQITAPSDSVTGTSGNDPFALTRDANNTTLIDWTLGSATGQILANDPNGLTLNGLGGNDTLTLDYSHGNPLPNTLHLNGIFSIVGLTGANPLAGVTLDIRQSTVYLNNPGDAVPLSLIRQYIATGYNQGAWTGVPTPTTGVITSTAAASSNPPNTAIGYADSPTGSVPSEPPNTIELRYTILGDSNLDGTVNSTDAITLARNYNLPTATTWPQGDFNYDAVVNMSDATLLQRNFNLTVPPVTFSAPAPTTSNSPISDSFRTVLPTQPISTVDDDSPHQPHSKQRRDRHQR
jgi:hypothetical protein